MANGEMISPYKFLDSYSREDKGLFFGREKEVEEVYSKTFQSPMLLVYGASGTGKSSIINCGLANKFNDSDWLPIHIRRGGNIRSSMFRQIQKMALNPVDLSKEEENSDAGIIKALNSVFLDHFKPIYLIFDQFEELFIFGYKDEWKDFISSVKEILKRDLEVRLIFVIRGEYLEFLSEFEEELPDFFDNRVRIEKMTRKNAQDIISGPLDNFPIDLENGFEEKLIKKLSPENSQVELTFLQVFLDKIYKMSHADRAEDGKMLFQNSQIDQIGQVADVLAEFVDEQIFKMPDPRKALTVLKSFVSLQGTKVLKNRDEVQNYTRDIGKLIPIDEIDEIISELVNKRILKEQDDDGRYELKHDSLAEKIFEKITIQERELLDVKQFLAHSINEFEKRGTLLNDEDLQYISPYERQLELDQKTLEFISESRKRSGKRKRQRRTRNLVLAVIGSLLITSVFALIIAQQQRQKAEELAELAKNEAQESEKQRNIALGEKQRASDQARIAEEQKQLAVSSQEESDRQRSIAINERKLAQERQIEAEAAKRSAEKSEAKARAQEGIAVREKEDANRQREIVSGLRILALSRELALKSLHILDPDLKALLAATAYDFNESNQGDEFQPEIYSGLYFANRKLNSKAIPEIKASSQSVNQVFETKDRLLVSTTEGFVVSIDKALNGKPKGIYEGGQLIETSCFDKDGSLIYLGAKSGEVILVDLKSGSELDRKKLHDSEIRALFKFNDLFYSVSKDGKILSFTGSLALVNEMDLKSNLTYGVAGVEEIFVSDSKGKLRVISPDLEAVAPYTPYDNQKIMSLVHEPNSGSVALGYQRGEIIIWDPKTKKATTILPGHSASITDLKFSKNGELLISSSFDRSIRIWNYKENQLAPIVIPDHRNWVSKIHLSQDGQGVYSGDYEGNVRYVPLNSEDLRIPICRLVSRQLSSTEWQEYVSKDLEYKAICNEN